MQFGLFIALAVAVVKAQPICCGSADTPCYASNNNCYTANPDGTCAANTMPCLQMPPTPIRAPTTGPPTNAPRVPTPAPPTNAGATRTPTAVPAPTSKERVWDRRLGIATMKKYPNDPSPYNPKGMVFVQETREGALELGYELDGLRPQGKGEIHIHQGTSCDDPDLVGGHYFRTTNDPWDLRYNVEPSGSTKGSGVILTGHSLGEVARHVIVVHDTDPDTKVDTRVACAPILNIPTGLAIMDVYPGYTPGLTVVGQVIVSERTKTVMTLNYALKGLQNKSVGGIHIHTGKSCGTHEAVGGHFYKTPIDPWSTTYIANSQGIAIGSFDVEAGYPFLENANHAVVIHDSTTAATRIACGLIDGAISGASGIYGSLSGVIVLVASLLLLGV